MRNFAALGAVFALLSLAGVPPAGADQADPGSIAARTAASASASSISPPVGSDNAGAIQDDDGPDNGYLTYSWQNEKYSRDERRQMGYILVFLSCASIVGVLRPSRRCGKSLKTEETRS